jgi:hypothetical protein
MSASTDDTATDEKLSEVALLTIAVLELSASTREQTATMAHALKTMTDVLLGIHDLQIAV